MRNTGRPTLGLVVLIVTVIASGALALASSQSGSQFEQGSMAGESDTAPFRGANGTERLGATDSRGVKAPVGVATYTSRAGLLCLAAGPVRNGRVGRYGRGGFTPMQPQEAPGICGDLEADVAGFGGSAFAHSSASAEDVKVAQGIIYGVVGDRSTAVRVTWPDGSQTTSAAEAAHGVGHGVEGVFSLAARTGTSTAGTKVELLEPDGDLLHAFQL